MTSFIRRLALSLTATAALGIAPAFADYHGVTNEHDQVIIDAAKSPSVPLGDAQTKTVQQMYDYHGTYPPPSKAYAPAPLNRYAAASASISAPDLVGMGGAQDEMARRIYRPGSGTGW